MYHQYTILCTEEQITKALKLGAPIDFRNGDGPYISVPYYDKDNRLFYHNYAMPTAEQMIGWLETQHVRVYVQPYTDECDKKFKGKIHIIGDCTVKISKSRKEATIAAIDAALEYLTNNKKL